MTLSIRNGRWVLVGLVMLAVGTGAALGYNQYSDDRSTGKCATCHGNFRSSPYTSLKPGEGSWGDDLHDVHRNDMLTGDCGTCHGGLGGSRFPVSTYTSNGGAGFPAIGCIGCHGRDEGTGTVTGTGLRQHHWRAGEQSCGAVDCHTDANPANATPVGENILPPYYFSPDPNHPLKPTDPCNPGPAFSEGSFGATTLGLDNDGDGIYDTNDSNCGAATAGPGETSGAALAQLLVTAHDPAAGTLTVSFGSPCEATDNTLEFGALADLETYSYSGQACGLGTAGTYQWSYPNDDLFFLVVGKNATVEGSYGRDGDGLERPEDLTSAACPVPQELADRCDP